MVNTSDMNTKDTTQFKDLTLDIRSINNHLTNLFQRYSIALNKINGGEILGSD